MNTQSGQKIFTGKNECSNTKLTRQRRIIRKGRNNGWERNRKIRMKMI
jgi:hypothetical protein